MMILGDDVIRKIRKYLDTKNPFHLRNFTELIRKHEVGKGAIKEEPYFEMNMDGFNFLVLGFTGETPDAYKIAFIKRSHQLEDFALKISRSAAMRTLKEAHALELDRAKEDRGALGRHRLRMAGARARGGGPQRPAAQIRGAGL